MAMKSEREERALRGTGGRERREPRETVQSLSESPPSLAFPVACQITPRAPSYENVTHQQNFDGKNFDSGFAKKLGVQNLLQTSVLS